MSGCFFGPYVLGTDPPVGCQLEMYIQASEISSGVPPHAWTTRNNTEVSLDGTIEDLGQTDLDAAIYTVECDGTVSATNRYKEPYHRWRISLANAQEGDALWINGAYSGVVRASVSVCPEYGPLPEPSCSGNYEGCGGHADGGVFGDDIVAPPDDGGCDASSGAAAPGLIVAISLVATRRRRRPAASR